MFCIGSVGLGILGPSSKNDYGSPMYSYMQVLPNSHLPILSRHILLTLQWNGGCVFVCGLVNTEVQGKSIGRELVGGGLWVCVLLYGGQKRPMAL